MAGADSVIPPPLEDDDDDVAWALQTAAVQWTRGGRADAVVWLRRAVDAAIAAGNPKRTQALTRLAAEVADRLVEEAARAPDSAVPPPPSRPPMPSPNDVDELLTQGVPSPAFPAFPPPGSSPRASAQSLTNEIPIEFSDDIDEEDLEDDFDSDADLEDDDAPTIPPPSDAAALRRIRGHALLESDTDPDTIDASDDPFDSSPPVSLSRRGEIVSDDEVWSARHAAPSEDGEVREDELLSGPPPSLSGGTRDVSSGEIWSARAPQHTEVSDPPGPESSEPSDAPRARAEVPPSIAPQVPYFPPPADVSRAAEPAYDSEPPTEPEPEPEPELESDGPTLTRDVPASTRDRSAFASGPPSGPPVVGGIALVSVRGFEDVPEETQSRLAQVATLTTLAADEEVGSFGAALVTNGRVGIMPSIADVASAVASAGEVVFTRGSLPEGVALRVVALEDDTVVASWTTDDLEAAFADCPWVADELRLVADRFQALAGAALGPLGERLDEALRGLVLSRLDVKAYGSGETIVTEGKIVPGLHVVGGGKVELTEAGAVTSEASPGDFLFAAEVLSAGKARQSARAGKDGALVLFASRSVAHEMLMSVPPLLEILAG